MAKESVKPARSAGNTTTITGLAIVIIGALIAYIVPLTDIRFPWQHYQARDIISDLKPHLSQHAEIYTPGGAAYNESIDRWSAVYNPQFDAVVKVATEQDISETIKFANKHRKPFLAISGAHGTGVRGKKGVVGILMRGMDGVTVAEDGKTATIGGGALSGEVWETLWNKGKETVTGACACTGYVAPMLGGGHGWLQGRYGLMADNLVSARLVLANGEAITVSATERPDLFWALQGAGHNFGIVASAEAKVYDRRPETDAWTIETYIFTHDKLEGLYDYANEMLQVQQHTIGLAYWTYIVNNPEVDPGNPTIVHYLIYQGNAIPSKFSEPLHALGPINVQTLVTDLPGLAAPTMMDNAGLGCAHGLSVQRFPVGLQNFSTPGLRSAVDSLRALPPSLAGSLIILEQYSMRGVHQVLPDSTAFPERHSNLLLSPVMMYPPNADTDDVALKAGQQMRKALVEGSGKPLYAYVNYANGDESQEAMYGYEPWRLEKLRRLKRQFDPHGAFNLYNPIHLS